MKKSAALFLSAIIWFGITSCDKTEKKINEATEFDISYTSNLTVPTSTVVPNTPVDLTTPEIPTQATSKFSAQKTSTDLIDEIKLTKFDISTSTGNLDFLKSLTIYIKAAGTEVKVATKDNIPAGATSVSADLMDVNIKEQITKDNIQFRVTATFTATPSNSQSSLKLDQVMHVKGKKIG